MSLTSITKDFVVKAGLTIEGTSAVTSSTGTTSSLQVNGGVSIAKNLIVGTTATIFGEFSASKTTVGIFSATSAYIIGNQIIGGGLTINSLTDSGNLTNTGSIVTFGGVGIGKSLNVGGAVTIGLTTASSSVAAIYSNNTVYASYTSGVITNNSQQTLDAYSSNTYRTAKYLIQIVDGTNVHSEEILLLHDGTGVYMSEYAVVTNSGELGTFDSTIVSNFITLSFTPNYTPSAMKIKVVRTAITF